MRMIKVLQDAPLLNVDMEIKPCKHKNIHTELLPGHPGMIIGSSVAGKYIKTEIPSFPGTIKTYCADCGEKLKTVLLKK